MSDLQLAREKAREIRRLVARNIDPSAQRKEKRAALVEALDAERRVSKGEVPKNCFEDIARRWYAIQKGDWMDSYGSKVIQRLEQHVFPYIGLQPITSIEPPAILEVCRRVESQGTLETEHCSNVFRFGIAEHLLKTDPAVICVAQLKNRWRSISPRSPSLGNSLSCSRPSTRTTAPS